MDEDQNNAIAEQKSGDDEDVVNGGVGPGDAEEQGTQADTQGIADKDDPYGVKKRLGMQAKKHQREMRQMQEHLLRMQAQIGGDNAQEPQHFGNQPSYSSPGQPNSPGMTEEEKIQKAVRMALGAKEDQERQAQMAERQAHVQKQYMNLNNEFDKASEKYDDFDDVVRGDHVPFTSHVRDALLLIDNPADVAYRLGKNKSELERISKLHPLDQAREVNKLSFSLMGGNNGKPSSNNPTPNPLGSIKANPVAASSGNTSAASIRARMRAGTWK